MVDHMITFGPYSDSSLRYGLFPLGLLSDGSKCYSANVCMKEISEPVAPWFRRWQIGGKSTVITLAPNPAHSRSVSLSLLIKIRF